MGRVDFSDMECSIARTLAAIGDRWSLLVIRDAFYGIRRFDEFQADLGIARNVLADRLRKLVDHGVLTKVAYEARPPRYEYRLTDKGKDLLDVILTMMRWGGRWEAGSEGPPMSLRHLACGHDVEPVLTCSECEERLRLKDLRVHPVTIVGARDSEPSLVPAHPER